MPKTHRVVSVNMSFSAEEYRGLSKGIVPCHMEDKWFIYFENNNLHCHRSWTGYCIFIGKFKRIKGEYVLYEVLVNDSKQYEPQSDFHELKLFFTLIESIDDYLSSNILI